MPVLHHCQSSHLEPPDTDPLALCQSTSTKWSPALGDTACILISNSLGFRRFFNRVINFCDCNVCVASHILSGSCRWAGNLKWKHWDIRWEWYLPLGLKMLKCLNLYGVLWELDATFPKNCPAHTLLQLPSSHIPPQHCSSSFPLGLSRNIHTHISGLWRPLWHLNSEPNQLIVRKYLSWCVSTGVMEGFRKPLEWEKFGWGSP